MSTILFDWSTGVSGLGLPGIAEHSGKTNRVIFSYRANNRKVLDGAGPLMLDFEVTDAYAAIFLEFSFPTSYR